MSISKIKEINKEKEKKLTKFRSMFRPDYNNRTTINGMNAYFRKLAKYKIPILEVEKFLEEIL